MFSLSSTSRLLTISLCCLAAPDLLAAVEAHQPCARPAPGSRIEDPPELRSRSGVLELTLTAYDSAGAGGAHLYCYLDAAGHESPTLRVAPGDQVILHLKNAMASATGASAHAMHRMAMPPVNSAKSDPCTSGVMSASSTNLHFHGLTLPPTCHQDEVLKTSVQPGEPAFDYRFQIPGDQPPGLYWYHPHIHGFSKDQVLGGASGAILIEGIERAQAGLAGLPERVFVIRDQDLVNPHAAPAISEPVTPKFLIDRDGDAANNGTGFGKPAKDLSVNYVPVPYPDYQAGEIVMKPNERQLWRVVNASAITYLNLAVVQGHTPQQLGLVALDGVPLGEASGGTEWVNHLGVPPGGRVEFLVTGPPAGTSELLVTRTVDTGPGGENDPNRALARITASADAPELTSRLPAASTPLPVPTRPLLGSVTPVRVRHLYFSEHLTDPNNPASATDFFITAEGDEPVAFDPAKGLPNLTAQQGTVEDWIIENRSNELHAFHVHQLHFMLLDYMGKPVDEPFLRDTVNVPYYNGRALSYPSVRIRMDFRGANVAGDFPYHCHLLEHEDRGMMGILHVEAAKDDLPAPAKQ